MTFETRTVDESRVFCLALNSVFANAEQSSIMAAATSEDALREFYFGERLPEAEIDGGYRLAFREGPLRHCNPLDSWHHVNEHVCGWQQGWFDIWTDEPTDIRGDIHRVDF